MLGTRPRISIRRMMVLVAACSLVSGGLAWVLREEQRQGRFMRSVGCSNNLKEIALALHNYHERYGSFPPAYIADAQGKPMHSWRVLILPYMEQKPLFDAYNFAEPWDGPNNRKLADRMPSTYACPNGHDAGGYFQGGGWISRSPRTNYLAVAGPGTAFPGGKSVSLSDIHDSLADTVMVAEIADSGISWMDPRDLDSSTMSYLINDPSKPSLATHDFRDPNVLCVDGLPRRIKPGMAPGILKAMMTINGGEPVHIRDAQAP